MIRILIALLLAVAPAAAQAPGTASSAVILGSGAMPTEYTLTVTPQDVELLGAAINELPAKFANVLAKKLQAQIDAQIAAANKQPKPEQ